MFTPSPKQRARRHIQKIREEFGLASNHGAARAVVALENALEKLSNDLFSSSTHFLLELIQNADDNEYENASPSLNLTYEPGKLTIQCNEKGFSAANVEAICRIGESTKRNKSEGSTRYIGEKGIGFKSVFKVADKVWISSNSYDFCFDKTAPLGMLAPTWDESYSRGNTPGTTIVLQLSNNYDGTQLKNELSTLDGRMLIFLHKLRHIHVEFKRNYLVEWETDLRRVDGDVHGEKAVQLISGSNVSRYVLYVHPVHNLPADDRRPGQTESELVLAFPVADKDLVNQPTEKAYAFLPIRDYGFKFLIQGDFLLSASREDILLHEAWNIALRDAFVSAFITAIRTKHQRYLQHLWPQFLPAKGGNNNSRYNFFGPAIDHIADNLKQEPMLLNFNDQLRKPENLFLVPSEFRADQNGQILPILLSSKTREHYVSDVYGEASESALLDLGVRKMTARNFIEDLITISVEEREEFQSKPAEWQSMLALRLTATLRSSDMEHSLRGVVRKLPIIPLSDGLWVAAELEGLFLPPQTDFVLNVQGVGVKLVDSAAARDRGRASLYEYLDVRTVDNDQLCQLIARLHQQPLSRIRNMSRSELVSQMLFLFKCGFTNATNLDFWIYGENGGTFQTSFVYLRSSQPFSVSEYCPGSGIVPVFLHAQYFDECNRLNINVESFTEWLERVMRISKFWRIFKVQHTAATAEEAVKLSLHFNWIIQNDESALWLVMLRDNWQHYMHALNVELFINTPAISSLTLSADALRVRHAELLEQIGSTVVSCIDEESGLLQEAYLPLPFLLEHRIPGIPIANVPDPENPGWKHLKVLGLGVEADLMFYMRCLQQLSEDSMNANTPSDVSQKVAVYFEQIQARYAENEELVRTWFSENCLIRVRPTRRGSGWRWVQSRLCLWEGQKCLRHIPVLQEMYPGCATLFKRVLKLDNSSWAHLAQEASFLEDGDDIDHLKELLDEIERSAERIEKEDPKILQRIAAEKIFPIIKRKSQTSDNPAYDYLAKADSSERWFIADRQELYNSFAGLIPLLAFDLEQIQKLKMTFQRLGVDGFRLSRCAESRPGRGIQRQYDSATSNDFRRRRDYVLRLIPSSVPMRVQRVIATRLHRIEVYYARDLTQDWHVAINNQQVIRGRPSASKAFCTTEDDDAHIYLIEGYWTQTKNYLDLVKSLASYCEIPGDREMLLNTALLDYIKVVEENFETYGIPKLDERVLSNEPIKEDYQPQADLSDDETSNEENDYAERIVTGRKGAKGENIETGTGKQAAPCPHCHSKNGKGQIGLTELGLRNGNGIPNGLHGLMPQLAELDLDELGDEDYYDDDEDDEFSPGGVKLFGIKLPGATNGSGQFILPSLNPAKRSTKRTSPAMELKSQRVFSRWLKRVLGVAYQPSQHWTSPLRTQDGLPQFSGTTDTYSTFTLPDPDGLLTQAMVDLEYAPPEWVKCPPTWHFEVEPTEGDLRAPFSLTNAQVERARNHCHGIKYIDDGPIPSDYVVLVCVYDLTAPKPRLALYVDPWTMFLYDKVKIKAESFYRCGIVQDGSGK